MSALLAKAMLSPRNCHVRFAPQSGIASVSAKWTSVEFSINGEVWFHGFDWR
jgi:hypothetical protein